MTLEAVENAPAFAETWNAQQPPYELPNGEQIDAKDCPHLTIRGQKQSINPEAENIITLIRSPTREVFVGFDLFFIFEKTGLLTWQFRTIDIDGREETHIKGRYKQVQTYTQNYINKYIDFEEELETCVV